MRALLVVNPQSHRGESLGERVRAELERRGFKIFESLDAIGDVDCIVVAGGDGTLVRLIGPAIEFDLPIGIIPLGTFNDLARTLGVPFDVEDACALVASGATRRIDVARVNGVYYVNEASIGISSRVARMQAASSKRRFGLLAVAVSILQVVRHWRPMMADIVYDGKHERLRTLQLTIANSYRFGGLVAVDDAAIDDGWLDLYSVEIDSLAHALSIAAAVAAGKRQDVPGLRTLRARAFSVSTRHPHRITADGEPAGRTPANFEVLSNALRVFAPRPA